MEAIQINGSQKRRLCDYLAYFVMKLKKDVTVECIYMAPYRDLGDVKGKVFRITVVVKDHLQYEKEIEYGCEGKKISAYEQDMRNYGMKIYTNVDRASCYTEYPLNPSECLRANRLFNSTILFDRTGEYKAFKKSLEKQRKKASYIYQYSNVTQISPPIIGDLKAMIEETYEEGTVAVKESMKSKLFEQYKTL